MNYIIGLSQRLCNSFIIFCFFFFLIRNHQPIFIFLKFIYRNDEFDSFYETRLQYSIFISWCCQTGFHTFITFFIRNYQPSFTFLKFIYRIRNDEFESFYETRSQYSIFSRDVVKQASIHLSLRREVIQRNFEKSWLT